MVSIEADRAFRNLTRTLAAERREPIPGTSDELVPAVDDGFASLDPDPDLFPEFLYPKKRKRDDEDDSNEMYLREYSRPSARDFSRPVPIPSFRN